MNQRARLSLLVVQVLIFSLLIGLLGRLFYLQVAAGPKYRDAALSIQSRDVVTPATRGLIVDSSGVPLALNRVGIAVTVDRTKIDLQPDKGVAVLQALAKLLKLDYADIYQRTRLCGELPKGAKAGCWTGSRFQPIPITKEADPEIALKIVERSDEYPGVSATPVSIRNYPGNVGVNGALPGEGDLAARPVFHLDGRRKKREVLEPAAVYREIRDGQIVHRRRLRSRLNVDHRGPDLNHGGRRLDR